MLTTIVVCAVSATSTSSWPAPTVSTMHDVVAGRVHHGDDVVRGGGQPAERAARRHAADEDAGVGGQVLHADAVAEDGAVRERAGRVDGDDAERLAALAVARGRGRRSACSCPSRTGR